MATSDKKLPFVTEIPGVEKSTITIGSRIRIFKNGPKSLIVDIDPIQRFYVVSWKDGKATREKRIPFGSIASSR